MLIDIKPYLYKEKIIAVIGLGYVGLPLALSFAKKYKVIAYDINTSRIQSFRNKIDPNHEVSEVEFFDADIEFTDNTERLHFANVYIITVPTPIDEYHKPDLSALISATNTVSRVLKKNDIVIYESTVYPGCTEEDCVPILEKNSGLTYMKDFKVGYSPERINPGDKEHCFTKIKKVVAGCDIMTTEFLESLYGNIVVAGIYKACSIKVAEAAKIIENTQRDVNIGLMNELSIIFHNMGINTYDVLETASTKWNFVPFQPGLVGGHCIGVDPYYLSFKAAKLGYHPQIINAGRFINDAMPAYVAKNIIMKLVNAGKEIKNARILILGITFKENISDIRNSKIYNLIKEIYSYGTKLIEVYDVRANSDDVKNMYNINLIEFVSGLYDVIVLAVPHKEFTSFSVDYLKGLLNEPYILFDLKGIFRKFAQYFDYWSL